MWTLPILAYHRVGDLKGDHVPTVTPESFEIQLRYLQRRGYQSVDLNALLAPTAPSRRGVIITFDDGYEGTAAVAAPLLHRYGFRAIVFVTPGEVGTPGFMTWEQIRAIAENGFAIGSHTMHHAYLPLLSREKAHQELAESKHALERHLGRPIDWLSYPVGGYSQDIQTIARSLGYRGACTTNRGISKHDQDLFALRRIKMTDRDRHPVLLWAKLCGYYNAFRRLEQPS